MYELYRFIFVDDEDFIRELFTDLLDYSQYHFELAQTFPNAEQAIAYLKTHSDIDVVITDIKMGELSGLDLCQQLYLTKPDLTLVLFSGYREFDFAQKAIKCDVFDYLLKPASYSDLDLLFNRLRDHLDKKAATAPAELDPSENELHYTHLIDRAKEYIGENFAKEISLSDVAQYVALSPTYLSRFFKKQTGKNFVDYLAELRISKAIELLQDPTNKVYEICEMVGYKSIKHFYKIFKQYANCTPSEFREQMGNEKSP